MWLKLKLTPKGDFCVVSVRAFFSKFLYAQYVAIPEWANIVTFHPRHPKGDQNLQFTLQTKTTSIPVSFIWESPGLFLHTGNKILVPADHPLKTKDAFGFLGIYL